MVGIYYPQLDSVDLDAGWCRWLYVHDCASRNGCDGWRARALAHARRRFERVCTDGNAVYRDAFYLRIRRYFLGSPEHDLCWNHDGLDQWPGASRPPACATPGPPLALAARKNPGSHSAITLG